MGRRVWFTAVAATGLLGLTAAPAAAIPPSDCGRTHSCVTTYYAYGYPGVSTGQRGSRCDGSQYSWGELFGYQVTVKEICGIGNPE